MYPLEGACFEKGQDVSYDTQENGDMTFPSHLLEKIDFGERCAERGLIGFLYGIYNI